MKAMKNFAHPKVRGIAALLLLTGCGIAGASPPTRNELGFHYKVIVATPPEIEIRLQPRRDFDAVSLEAASGVASVSPPCTFSNLVAGTSYVCRVEIAGAASEPAMTLNVIARRAGMAAGLPITEIHHLTLRNASFSPSAKTQAPSKHVLPRSATTGR